MSARRDPRTGRWYFRCRVRTPGGGSERLYGVPSAGDYPDLTNTKVGAQEAERRAISAFMRGESVRPKPETKEVPTIKEYADTFLTNYAASHKPSERSSKSQILNGHLFEPFGHLRLDEILQEAIDAFVAAELARGMKKKTVNNRLTVLSTLLRYAAANNVIPLPRLKFNIGGQPGKIEAVPAAHIEALLALADPLYCIAILLAAEAGLRAGEIRGLQWTDVDLELDELVVRRALDKATSEVVAPKHDKIRTVPVSERLARALEALPKRGIWVLAQAGGEYLSHQAGLWRPIAALYDQAKVRRPSKPVHCLRHSYGTENAARGVPLPVLRELMGHARIETTMRYIDVNASQKREAIAATFGMRSGSGRAAGRKPSRKRK